MDNVSLGRRFGALVVDWLIASLSAAAVAGVSYPPENVRQNLIITGFSVVEVAVLTGLLGFSIGKRLFSLKVEGPDGNPIGLPRAVLRTLLMVPVIPALVMTKDRRGLHDLAARSRVIRV
ncbi:RDD family protein [Aeromicrobium sp.]|uniref:RDD family protein n=1 Tax=Aeromicrobium sp. TaxID=1871063 RepID=UPI0019BA06BA|nr:RDD family protein [Aeromicrobium sp.]MBC7632066.1 RDD family protein [Aeromicrobium sp.]